jgi:hypothetical protein
VAAAVRLFRSQKPNSADKLSHLSLPRSLLKCKALWAAMAKDRSAVPSSPLNDLRLALAEADFALTEANTPEEGRIATLLALKAIYDFSQSTGLRSKALNNLSMALQDIDRGNSATLFAPSIQNRPRDKARLFILKAVAAAAMQLLMDSGKTKAAAAAIVATKLDLAGFRLPGLKGRSASHKTIALWRDKFGGHSDEEGADSYNFSLQQARATFTRPDRQADFVMRGLKRLVENLDKSPS